MGGDFLDFDTILFTEKASRLVGFASIIYIYFSGAPRQGMLSIAAAFLLHSIGTTAISFIHLFKDFWTYISFVALWAGIVGHAALAIGVIQMAGSARIDFKYKYAWGAVALLLVTIFTYVFHSERLVHAFWINFFGVLSCMVCAVAMIRAYVLEKNVAAAVLAGAFVFNVLIYTALEALIVQGISHGSLTNLLFYLMIPLNFFYAIFIVLLQRERLDSEITRRSNVDLLTGIANRRSFFADVEKLERLDYAVLLFDIDYFKAVNDGYGHLAGDQVLKQVAQTIKSTIRGSDTLARYGGEEFIVFAASCSTEDAEQLAERIRARIESIRVPVDDKSVSVTISGGVCHSERGSLPLESVIRCADAALYRAKENGRNRVERWDEAMAA